MNKKVYGVKAQKLDAMPAVRAGTIDFWKKAILYFIPNRSLQQNEISNVGNPTKSAGVNNLVKELQRKQLETRPMNNEEYCSIIQILKSSKDATEKYDI